MTLTPAMKQYVQIKEENPDCVVMFRMGDFYELFYEDAKTAAQVLGITLTSRGKGDSRAPLAGIPYHAVEQYVKKFVQQGYKLAIVEQLEDPKKAKGVVKRGLVRIITPGTIIEDSILSQSSNNYLCSLYIEKSYGLSFCDISTGEFLTTSCDGELKLFAELEKFRPSEILVPVSQEDSEIVSSIKQRGFVVSSFDDRFFWKAKAEKTILSHFQAETLEGFGVSGITVSTSGALLSYLQETQKKNLAYINRLQHYSVESFMILDSPTQRNLELLRNIRDNTTRGTVFEVINKTRTSMGARKLKNWLVRPLRDRGQIVARHDACEEIIEDAILVEDLKDSLGNISDIERILSRVTYGTANGRDLVSLRLTLEQVKPLKELLSSAKSDILISIRDMDDLVDLQELISKAIRDEPPAVVREGNIIREGYNAELDELRNTTRSGRAWISDFEEKERERTGIKNLKVRYNKVFGYFIEVTKANLRNVPDDYVRKQTQVNAERFITDELKEKESLVLGAQDKINALEYDLFCEVLQEVIGRTDGLQDIARKIATLDCILSLGVCALQNQYVRPEMTEDRSLEILGGRHPVVETIEKGSFVSNDTNIGDAHIHIITGPNMAGKSTYLRQVALITLLSQIGSFVPAASAKIGIVDRIFSRVGAYDDLSMGQSTFMVEMSETANILNNATGQSLIIMDEVGRGTSTYDGLSLAWAIIEFIRDEIGANTLFATHYHHLNRLAAENDLIENYNVLVEEHDEKVVFLHKIVKGGTDKSYGIHVANIAGMPSKVIERSKVIMDRIENQEQLTITLAPRSRDDEDLEFMEPEPRRRKMKRDTPPITQQTLFQWDQ
ncbi:MAG: DNA mismatch repair protein MutS [Candidatus Woesearchaeota archaeon]